MKRLVATLAVVLMNICPNTFAVDDPPVDSFITGVHVGIGLGGYWDYPSEYLGSNDWMNVALDLGCVFNIRVNRYLSVVPELGFGMIISS
ncbi:hypothetical protein [Fibrobacter sp. UBA4297]|uniref:hypothetical protein n=1 Tax=Fibrobacter sp. UBA4297 TaxID=1946536 RepID=UPI0025BAA1F5|nr:hypothetical protein [Fibrobacter sp. UBA4297]